MTKKIFGSDNEHADTVPTSHEKPSKFESDLLKVREAAEYLRCSKSYLDKLRCVGGGPQFMRLGVRKIVYRRIDLEAWGRARRYDSTSQYDQ